VARRGPHYWRTPSADKLPAARRGDVLFYRLADLPPGRYTVEAVAYDAQSQKGSVTTAALEVPASQDGRPRLSSVVLVGRAEKVTPAEAESDSPLIYGETLIYPNMGEPFRKSTSSAVGFFFTLYGVKDAVPPAPALAQTPAAPVPAPLTAEESFAKGVQLQQSGDVLGAIEAYQDALGKEPQRIDARSNLGAAYVRLGRYEEAVREYRRALEVDPG